MVRVPLLSVDQISSTTHLFHLAPHGTRAFMSVDQVSSFTHLFHLAPQGTRAFMSVIRSLALLTFSI